MQTQRLLEIVAWKNDYARLVLDPRFKARLALPPADVELPNTEWVSNHHCCVPIYYLRG